MAIQKTEALVIRAAKFRDTSLITTFFTSDFGKIKALSKGIRKERGTLLTHYEPFSHVEIVFYEKTKSDIHFLSESYLLDYFSGVRRDFEKVAWACYMMDLLDAVLPLHDKCPHLMKLILEILKAMEMRPPSSLVAVFTIKLLLESGILPDLAHCMKCGGENRGGYLSFEEGSIFCEGCWRRAEGGDYVARELVLGIRYLAESHGSESLNVSLSGCHEESLHRLLNRWIQYRFDKDLSSFRFLREVGLIGPCPKAFDWMQFKMGS